jgi:hypothetical protein
MNLTGGPTLHAQQQAWIPELLRGGHLHRHGMLDQRD